MIDYLVLSKATKRVDEKISTSQHGSLHSSQLVLYSIRLHKGKQLRRLYMATNPPKGDGHRHGAVRDRSQVKNPVNGNWTKRDKDTGQFMDQKTDGKPFKGVTKEK